MDKNNLLWLREPRSLSVVQGSKGNVSKPADVLEFPKPFELWDFQQDCVDRILVSEAQRILLIANMGAGKTGMASWLMRYWWDEFGQRSIFLVDRTMLLGQTVKALNKLGLRSTVFGEEDCRQSPAVVVSMQLLESRLRKATIEDLLGDRVGLIIPDEAHKTVWRKVYKTIHDHYRARASKFVGLTATPWCLAKDRWMGQWFEETVEAPQPPELVRMKRILPSRPFVASNSVFDLSQLDIGRNGDYKEEQMTAQAITNASLTCVVNKYLEKGEGMPFAAFCAGVEHAKMLAQAFCDAGIPCGWQEGNTPLTDREKMSQQIYSGELRGICSVGTMTEGFDNTAIGCVLFVRATKSKALFHQGAGRAARTHPGQSYYLLLDFGGNLEIERHGNPSGYQNYSIDKPDDRGKRKGDGESQGKKCPECGHFNSNFARVCEACDYEFTSEESDEDLEENDELLMVEWFDKTDRAKVKMLRDAKRRCFADGISPDVAVDEFVAEYGHIPYKEWHQFAVLGKRASKKKIEAFKEYLRGLAKHENWYNWQFNLERGFGNGDSAFSATSPWWEVLGVNELSDRDEMKRAYRELAREYHPDTSADPEAEQKMKIINRAWDEACLIFGRR